jgi:hypothetical protein
MRHADARIVETLLLGCGVVDLDLDRIGAVLKGPTGVKILVYDRDAFGGVHKICTKFALKLRTNREITQNISITVNA